MGCALLQSKEYPASVPLADSRSKEKVVVQREGKKCKAATTFPKECIHLLNL